MYEYPFLDYSFDVFSFTVLSQVASDQGARICVFNSFSFMSCRDITQNLPWAPDRFKIAKVKVPVGTLTATPELLQGTGMF